jgi:hypothetical protein
LRRRMRRRAARTPRRETSWRHGTPACCRCSVAPMSSRWRPKSFAAGVHGAVRARRNRPNCSASAAGSPARVCHLNIK